RRELAATARRAGAPMLAIQVLLDGDQVPEAVELADREVEALRRADRLDDARQLVRLLPRDALAEHPHLLELGATHGTVAEEAPRHTGMFRWRLEKQATAALLGG